MPGPSGRDPADWFVRRAGLARFSTFACALGLALAAVAGARPRVALAGLVIALAGLLGGLYLRRGHWGYRLLIVCVVLSGLFSGYVLGTVRVAGLSQGDLLSRVGETADAELVVTGSVRANSGWQSATARIRRLDSVAMSEPVWLEVPPGDSDPGRTTVPLELQQGMIVSGRVIVEAPEERSRSGYDQAKQLLQQGIRVVLRAKDPGSIVTLGRREGLSGWFDGLRRGAKEHLDLGPAARLGQVLQGVVMGDTAGIDRGWLEAFRRSGTAHMLSVSGLHVASLAAIMLGLARLLGAARWVGFLLASVSALLMIPFVGPSPPIIRAAVMIIVVLVGRWVGRGRDQWQILALAAVVIMAINPFALFDVGFQLSFSALGGILAVSGPLQRLMKRLPAAIASNVSVSLAASIGTAPVALAVFGRTSLVSPLANLLVVPALPLITGFGMASAFLGFVWHGFSLGLDTLASLPMSWVVSVSRLMALVPLLNREDLGRTLAAFAGAAAVLPVSLALVGRVAKTPFGLQLPFFRSSLRWVRGRRPRDRRYAWALAVSVAICGLLLGLVAYPVGTRGVHEVQTMVGGRSWPDQVELRVLDVGQGNAVLVRTPAHHALLFDGGPEDCELADQLRALGVSRLDLVVISHPHADHFAGLQRAFDGLEVAALADHVQIRADPQKAAGSGAKRGARPREPKAGGEEALEYLRLREQLAESGCRYSLVGTGCRAYVDGVSVQFFAPGNTLVLVDGGEPWAARGGAPSGDELNDASLVAVVTAARLAVLLPGDAEAGALSRYDLPGVDVVVVPHHGSEDALSERLLSELRPKVGIISVGRDNFFGHPSAGTVSLLERTVGAVIRTDTAGWVSCRLEEGRIAINTERTPTW